MHYNTSITDVPQLLDLKQILNRYDQNDYLASSSPDVCVCVSLSAMKIKALGMRGAKAS